jgi:hypothetical protein
MTSIGLMSAAKTTIPCGTVAPERVDGVAVGDFRIALTVSLTPRVRCLCLAAAYTCQSILVSYAR